VPPNSHAGDILEMLILVAPTGYYVYTTLKCHNPQASTQQGIEVVEGEAMLECTLGNGNDRDCQADMFGTMVVYEKAGIRALVQR